MCGTRTADILLLPAVYVGTVVSCYKYHADNELLLTDSSCLLSYTLSPSLGHQWEAQLR